MSAATPIDFDCMADFYADFRTVQGVIPCARQDVYHRLTTASILVTTDDLVAFPEGYKLEEFGVDLLALLGSATTPQKARLLGPTLAAVCERSQFVQTADVLVSPYASSTVPGGVNYLIRVTCTTREGPFSFVFPVADLTIGKLQGL